VPEGIQEEVAMRRLISALLGGVFLFASLSPVSATEIPDEWWTPVAFPQGDGWRSLFLSDNSTLNREPSRLLARKATQMGVDAPAFHCATVDSPKCIELDNINAKAFLQPCSSEITTNCIENFYATDPSGLRLWGFNPVPYPPYAPLDFKGNDAINLPTGGAPTIWEIPGAEHGGAGSSYIVQAFTSSFLEKKPNQKVADEKFVMHSMTVNVSPVTLIDGRYVRQIAQDSTETSPGANVGVRHDSVDEWRYCAMIDTGSCAKRQPFPKGYTFGVKIRLQQKLSGWLHGRIYNPDVSITTDSSQGQIIEVSASPVSVPVVGEWYRWENLTPEIQKYILDGKVQGGQGHHDTKSLATGNFQEIISTSGQNSMETLALWIPQIKDKASATQSTWTFNTLSSGELANSNACIKDADDLVGFVTTNAAAYSAGPPAFNRELQSLDYKVIAPHHTAKGEIFRGSYDLKIRASVARCIYGFTDSPIQGSISIVAEDGSMQVATQTVSESAGWLSLSANGFTYSSPTISAKLTQKAPEPVLVTPIQTPTPSPVATAKPLETAKPVIKKVTITCTKGKTTKKVTATKPACPKGFKKSA
jgi:hypothetical protein